LTKPIYSPEFRAKVALTALIDEKLNAEIFQEFDLEPSQVKEWVFQLIDAAPGVFAAIDAKKPKKESTTAKAIRDLIGRN